MRLIILFLLIFSFGMEVPNNYPQIKGKYISHFGVHNEYKTILKIKKSGSFVISIRNKMNGNKTEQIGDWKIKDSLLILITKFVTSHDKKFKEVKQDCQIEFNEPKCYIDSLFIRANLLIRKFRKNNSIYEYAAYKKL